MGVATMASLVAQTVKESAGVQENLLQCRHQGLTPRSGRSPGEGNGNPFQYSCLGNPVDRRAWQATVHGDHKESDMTERLTHSILN